VRALLATPVFFVLLGQLASAVDGREVTLALPHPLRAGESAWLEVKLGVLERGAEIEIATAEGRSLGVISPFGIRSGRQAGTYTVPVPADAISADRLSLVVSINQNGHPRRAPTTKELKRIRVKIRVAGQPPARANP
jgi:hypothetical protein